MRTVTHPNTSSGIVGITDNGQNVYIVDGQYRYTWRISNPSSATFIGTISGNVLTVTLMKSGTIAAGQQILCDGITAETIITALGTGTGGVGTYTINISQTLSSREINATTVAAQITASITGTVLTVISTLQSSTQSRRSLAIAMSPSLSGVTEPRFPTMTI